MVFISSSIPASCSVLDIKFVSPRDISSPSSKKQNSYTENALFYRHKNVYVSILLRSWRRYVARSTTDKILPSYIFRRSRVRVSADRPAILTQVLCSFPQTPLRNTNITSDRPQSLPSTSPNIYFSPEDGDSMYLETLISTYESTRHQNQEQHCHPHHIHA
jgi:hypothetical protein